MNKILSSFLLLMSCNGYSQTATDETLTSQKLDKGILVKSTCTAVSEGMLSTSIDHNDDNGCAADPMAKIYIFDTFGKLLKQGNSLVASWRSVYNGKPLALGDCSFLDEYSENEIQKEFIGHFTPKTIAI